MQGPSSSLKSEAARMLDVGGEAVNAGPLDARWSPTSRKAGAVDRHNPWPAAGTHQSRPHGILRERRTSAWGRFGSRCPSTNGGCSWKSCGLRVDGGCCVQWVAAQARSEACGRGYGRSVQSRSTRLVDSSAKPSERRRAVATDPGVGLVRAPVGPTASRYRRPEHAGA
jgi:hypothetical protein